MINLLIVIGIVWVMANVVNSILLTLNQRGRLIYELSAVKPVSGCHDVSKRETLHHRYSNISLLIGLFFLAGLTGFEGLHLNQSSCSMAYFVALLCLLIPVVEIAWFNLQASLHGPKDMSAASVREATGWIVRYYRYPMSLNGIARQRLRFIMFSTGVIILLILATYLIINQ